MCVCHFNTTRHAQHFPVRHVHRHKLVLMEARWNDPGCVPSHGAHPCGSASVPGPVSSAVGNPQGGPPPYRETDASDWFVLIKIITKCWYSLIVQNIVLLFFIEILHLHKFTWGFCFWNHKVQTCDIKPKCDYREKEKYRLNINISHVCL